MDVKANNVRKVAVEFYRLLRRRNFDTDSFIIIGGAALVLYSLLEKTPDIDITTDRKSLYRLKKVPFRSCEKTLTLLRVRKNKVDYEIGLPPEFDLVKPWYVKERIAIEDVFVNVRPRYLLKADCELQVRIVEDIARGIDVEPSVFRAYVKYKTRLERLSESNQ